VADDSPSGRGRSTGGEGARALTAAAIAAAVGGTVRGDPEATVSAVAPLDRAEPHHLSFLASARYASLLAGRQGGAGVVLVTPDLAESPGETRARVVVANPHEALLSLLATLHPPAAHVAAVHATAVIGRGARIGDRVAIGPYVVIGDGARIGAGAALDAHVVVGAGVTIGDECHVYPGVTLYSGTSLGARVRVHAGVRLGSDGFGYVFRGGVHDKIPHVGRCVVEDDVEIGANTTIDRGSIDDTVIGAGTKIDNLVHVAHNVRIGRLCLIMAQVGIAGSVRVEDGCILAGQAGIAGHHTIGRGARLAAQAGAFGDVPAGETWSGYPARPHREALRAQAAMFRLPSLLRGIERLLGERPDDRPR
jgi:UDP-3-O-[3-hydroxymyristoyl] glucosamine N-acyltransferase